MGVALVAKGKLQALSVVSAAQGRGVGSALVRHASPRFVSAIMAKVPWFERLGYTAVGAARPGQNGKMAVQLMELAGDVVQARADVRDAPPPSPASAPRAFVPLPDLAATNWASLGDELLATLPPSEQALGVDVDKACHRKQASLVNSLLLRRRRNICCLAGRQSGKSYGGALAAVIIGAAVPGVNLIYVASTYSTCRKMAFLPAVDLNRDYGLGGEPKFSTQDMSLAFPNGAVVYFLGADSDKTVQRLRGTPNLLVCIVDEAGIYSSDTLAEMIRAVRPGLRPRAGTLCVMGTPSRQGKQGTFYNITENPEYDQHRFDYADNDKVPTFDRVEELIDEDLRAEFPHLTPAQARETAWFKREYKALFEVDLAEMVYQIANDNLVDEIPSDLEVFVAGGDLGMSANDAIVGLGWKPPAPEIYVTDQEEASGQDSIAYAGMAKAFYERRRPLVLAIDPGGLGQKTIRTVQSMFPSIPITEAQKPPIGIQVRAVNTLAQGGRLKIKRGSKLALELTRPTWVDGIVGGTIDEHGKHSDLIPSLRYGCIAATPFLPDVKPPQTPEEVARERYLEGVARAERNRDAAQGPKEYDPAEFETELYEDVN